MNKVIRSLLLRYPKIYQLIYHLKNNYLINFYLRKVHEADFKAFTLLTTDSCQLFLDIGANVGMSALSIFTLKPNSKVVSFEPNPINHPYLDKLVGKFAGFQYLPIGLGDRASQLNFYYPVYNQKSMTALGSCVMERAESWLNADTVYFFDDDRLKLEKTKIEIKTLDSFQLEPDFIKIDVEGFEYQVIRGAIKTVSNHRPIFLIEGVAKDDAVHQQFKAWQYRAYKFHHNRFYLDRFDCDNNFFIPQEKDELVRPYLS